MTTRICAYVRGKEALAVVISFDPQNTTTIHQLTDIVADELESRQNGRLSLVVKDLRGNEIFARLKKPSTIRDNDCLVYDPPPEVMEAPPVGAAVGTAVGDGEGVAHREDPLPRDVPRGPPLPRDDPQDAPLPPDVPHGPPLRRGDSQDAPLPCDRPRRVAPLPRGDPQDATLPRDIPQDATLPRGVRQDAPLPHDVPRGPPLPRDDSQDAPLPRDVPSGGGVARSPTRRVHTEHSQTEAVVRDDVEFSRQNKGPRNGRKHNIEGNSEENASKKKSTSKNTPQRSGVGRSIPAGVQNKRYRNAGLAAQERKGGSETMERGGPKEEAPIKCRATRGGSTVQGTRKKAPTIVRDPQDQTNMEQTRKKAPKIKDAPEQVPPTDGQMPQVGQQFFIEYKDGTEYPVTVRRSNQSTSKVTVTWDGYSTRTAESMDKLLPYTKERMDEFNRKKRQTEQKRKADQAKREAIQMESKRRKQEESKARTEKSKQQQQLGLITKYGQRVNNRNLVFPQDPHEGDWWEEADRVVYLAIEDDSVKTISKKFLVDAGKILYDNSDRIKDLTLGCKLYGLTRIVLPTIWDGKRVTKQTPATDN